MKLPRSPVPWTKSKAERLHRFAVSEDPVRRAVAAGHPRLDKEDRYALVHDPDVSVRRALVKNPSLPKRVLHFMTQDEDRGIAAYARMMEEK